MITHVTEKFPSNRLLKCQTIELFSNSFSIFVLLWIIYWPSSFCVPFLCAKNFDSNSKLVSYSFRLWAFFFAKWDMKAVTLLGINVNEFFFSNYAHFYSANTRNAMMQCHLNSPLKFNFKKSSFNAKHRWCSKSCYTASSLTKKLLCHLKK